MDGMDAYNFKVNPNGCSVYVVVGSRKKCNGSKMEGM